MGEPVLVLGRDADCAVCLPDRQRNVSRRHLSVRNEGEALHFLVLSVVNGVDVDGVEVPPGQGGVLLPGQVLVLADYRISVAAVAATSEDETDPWTQFEKEAARLVASTTVPLAAAEDDPFGDWGFQSTFGAGAAHGPPHASGLAAGGDLAPFFAGLGLPAQPGQFTHGELEAMGRLTRIALQGLLQALRGAGGIRDALRPDDPTVLEPRAANPLRMETPLESKLWYLFGGQASAAGCMAADRAVTEMVDDVLAHEVALAEAVREAMAGALREFAPGQDLDDRVQELLDRHFAEAYTQALLRAKRHSGGPTRG